jgi:uncharacterized protein YlxW (UPF0749 family)
MSPETQSIFSEYAGLWALLGTLFSGVVLAVVNKYLSRGRDQADIATELRGELRTENVSLKEEVRILQAEIAVLQESVDELRKELLKLQLINNDLSLKLIDCEHGHLSKEDTE